MMLRAVLISAVLVLIAQGALGSSDNFCEPVWTLNQMEYNRCSNLPFLTPANDSQVNLKLLLADRGLASLQEKPVSKEDADFGYGKVPFSLETFERDIFLPKDRAGEPVEPSGYADGSRCVSNEAGRKDFIEAVARTKVLLPAERQALTQERNLMKPSCVDVPAPGAKFSVLDAKNCSSPACREFMSYLAAAGAFYEGRYPKADSDFAALTKSANPWLKESSRYMLARAALNRSQQNAFDSNGFPQLDKVDRKALSEAEAKFNAYLKQYPAGRYAASARGLLRRIYWLSDRSGKLADEYEWQMSHPGSPQHNLSLNDFVREADKKLLDVADVKEIKSPMLLAALDLLSMRTAGSSYRKPIEFSELQKQRPLFAGHEALHEYLLAVHRYYVQKDPAGALKSLPTGVPAKPNYLDFSRLMLRGMALEATGDRQGARKLWLSLFPAVGRPLQAETLQLALALNYEYGKQLEQVFKSGSPITDGAIRSLLIRNDASPELLRRLAGSLGVTPPERHLALYTLLYKDLLLGRYGDYVTDHRLLPKNAAEFKRPSGMDPSRESHLALFTWSGKGAEDGYGCPATVEIAGRLAKNADDPLGLICLGDFINANDLDYGAELSGTSSSKASGPVLGSAPSGFSGKNFSRGEAYKTVLASGSATPDLKAYALYRSIKCYSPAGNNHCGGKDVEKGVRKGWFQTLKTRYPNSKWAKALKYYW